MPYPNNPICLVRPATRYCPGWVAFGPATLDNKMYVENPRTSSLLSHPTWVPTRRARASSASAHILYVCSICLHPSIPIIHAIIHAHIINPASGASAVRHPFSMSILLIASHRYIELAGAREVRWRSKSSKKETHRVKRGNLVYSKPLSMRFLLRSDFSSVNLIFFGKG